MRVVIHQCPIFGCGQDIEHHGEGDPDHCDNCDTPLWPLSKGFTGNVREHCVKFAAEHDQSGKPLK